jgi:hypothetical protein
MNAYFVPVEIRSSNQLSNNFITRKWCNHVRIARLVRKNEFTHLLWMMSLFLDELDIVKSNKDSFLRRCRRDIRSKEVPCGGERLASLYLEVKISYF